MLDIFNEPSRLHAMIVHFPVVLAMLGVPLIVALMVTRGRSSMLRWLIVTLYVVGSFTGFMAMQSGEGAVDQLSRVTDAGGALTDEAMLELEKHEEMGGKLWWMMLLPAAVTALTAIKRTPGELAAALVLALAVSVWTAGWAGLTGHHGGALVYDHGVGVPASPNNYPATSPR